MMRRVFLLSVSLFLVSIFSQKMSGQVRFYDARVRTYGQLEQTLGDRWNTIDSLVVHGPIDKDDFKTIVRCVRDGSVRIVNLQYAQVKDKKIPDYGFVDWSLEYDKDYLHIRRIILPDDITEFGEMAFYGMTLKTMNMPSSLRKLGEGCFENNPYLEGDPLIIPEGVTEIPGYCFVQCYGIKKIVLPSTIKTIDNLAFFYCKVEEMNFPEGLDSIGHNAIYDTALAEIILPNTVKKLGNGVFSKNEKLKKVVLPEGIVQKILL